MQNRIALSLSTILFAVGAAYGECGDIHVWEFDIETGGEDVTQTSPTALSLDAIRFRFEYEITLVEIDVSWKGTPYGPFDITGDISPELLSSTITPETPFPITLHLASFHFPKWPEDPEVFVDMDMLVDESGFGHLSYTDVQLGQYEVDLGPPHGVQTVDIEAVRAVSTMTVKELAPQGDIDDDCHIGFSDLLILMSLWGPCSIPCPADFNGNRHVGFSDMIVVLLNWGDYQ